MRHVGIGVAVAKNEMIYFESVVERWSTERLQDGQAFVARLDPRSDLG
jgi:hypothetical protein